MMSKNKVNGSRLERSTPFHHVNAIPKSVPRRLLPSLTVMMILLIIGAWALLWHQHQLARKIAAKISDVVYGDLNTSMDQQSAFLAAAAQPIAADATVQKALREGDADGLLAVWRPAFETLHRENHLTHFYFLDTNRVCLLRVHEPEKRGDLINRFTTLEAERTGKTFSGMDLGAMDTFTLRLVQPVFEGDTLVGYVELGEEIEHVLQPMHTRPGIQLAAVIRKEYLNRAAWEDGMRLLGRPADWDHLTHNAVIYASQGRLPDAFAFWADQASGENTFRKAEREIAFDGKDWRLSVIPLPDASGRTVGNLLIIHDITADKAALTRLMALGGTTGTLLLALLFGLIYILLRRADAGIRVQQAALRASEVRYRRLFESAKDGILILDAETGMVADVNPFLIQLLGISREEILGKKIWELGLFKDIVANQDSFAELQQQKYIRYEDKPLKTADGRQVDVEFVSNVYLVDDHKVIQCNIRDITARKQAETDHEELQAQLLQTQKLESIGTLAGGVAHEINNPIMGIMNYAQLIVDQLGPDSPATDYATEIGKETRRVATIVKNLLSFARLDKETHKSRARLCDIVEETLSLIRAVMRHDQITLLANVPADLPRILCRSQQIRQVIMNLLTNARDALNKKYPGHDENKKVIISAREIVIGDPPSAPRGEASEKHWLRLTVEDYGPGIPEELRARIFTPFFSTKPHHKGTGLGLSISHGIVTDHGGTLSVEGEAGQWTRFNVDLPVVDDTRNCQNRMKDDETGNG